jgi:uncharacterized protein with HEPN domain
MAKQARYTQRQLLEHIVELCGVIAQTLGDDPFETFEADRNLGDATAYRLQAIGEACTKLSEGVKAQYDIPWAEIVGMRHILSHDYLVLSKRIIWDTAVSDLGDLHEACLSALESIDG